VSRNALFKDIRETRTAAYNQWVKMRETQEASEVEISGKLRLEDAVKLAIRQNKGLQAILQEKEIARGKVIESYQTALPKVDATGVYTRLDKVNTFEVGDRSISLGDVDNYSVDLKVSQPLFRGGAIGAALRAAKLAELLSDEVARSALQGTIYEVALAYYDALLYQHQYEVNEDAVRSATVHLEDVRKRRKLGVASDYDVLRAEVDISNFRAEMIKQKNNLDLAKSRLLKAMGVLQKGDIDLADELEYWPMRPVLEEALKIGHENRPDLYRAELDVRLQKEALRVAKSRYWPQVDAFFQELWGKPDPSSTTTNEWNDTWNAGVSVNLSIFDGLGREGRVYQQKATLARSRYRLANTQEQAFLEIRQALLTLRNAEEFVESQKLNRSRATEGLRLTEVGYREGIASEVEVSDARSALTLARGLYYESVYGHAISRLNLQLAMGTLGPKPGEGSEGNEYVPENLFIREAGTAPGQPTQQEESKPNEP
ncbi:MAG: TolC family protein, partial [Thermodesulfobacteriota bacterium]